NPASYASPYNAIFYETLRLANINFDDHVKALDYLIAKWKPLEKPIRSRDLVGRDKILYYEEPKGIVSGLGGIDVVYENSKYISQLILASTRPLIGIKKCHDRNEERLTVLDAQNINEAIDSLGIAYDTMREYSIRIYNIRQSYQDLTDLHATRAKIIEGQAKLQEILSRGPQKKN
ncbi:MAG: hypothetical protein HYY62_07095, partial [Deltaproteobacteria bacterium]|nr:hypothetical protein [Deltaproteobacteria bacterium]